MASVESWRSSGGDWAIKLDYEVTATTFRITQIYGYRSNYASYGTISITISTSHGTANTSQTDTVTAYFNKGSWSSGYWKFNGANCNHYTVTGIATQTLTVSIRLNETFNATYIPVGTVFSFSVPMPVSVPSVGTPYAYNITRDSATIACPITSTGSLNITNAGIYYYKGGGYAGSVGGFNQSNIVGDVRGLTPNTVYAMNSWAQNGAGYGYHKTNITNYDETQLPSFTTSGNPPTITGFTTKDITRDYVKWDWSDSFETNASYKTYKIEYGTTEAYGNTLTDKSNVSGLEPNTTYYSKLTLTDNWNRSSTATTSFTTAGEAPVINYNVTNITATTAVINFDTVFDTNTVFKSGWISYGMKTIDFTEGTGSITLSGLQPVQTYNCEFGMEDSAGHVTVITITFTTLKAGATGYIKEYVDGLGVVWRRGTVYHKVKGKWRKGKEVRKKTGGVWSGNS